MSLVTLLNRPCLLVQRSASGDLDRFGNPKRDETTVATVCELQQQRRTEAGDAGELSDTTWALFLPAGTDVTTADTVIVDGQEYELVGEPWDARNPRTQVMSHIEATCRRTRGADDEPGS